MLKDLKMGGDGREQVDTKITLALAGKKKN